MKNMKKVLCIKIQSKLVEYIRMVGDNKQNKDWGNMFHEISLPKELLQQQM
jgi:hypothetical protein